MMASVPAALGHKRHHRDGEASYDQNDLTAELSHIFPNGLLIIALAPWHRELCPGKHTRLPGRPVSDPVHSWDNERHGK